MPVDETEGPVGLVGFLALFHHLTKLPKVSIVPQVECEGECRVCTGDVHLAHLLAVVGCTVQLLYFYLAGRYPSFSVGCKVNRLVLQFEFLLELLSKVKKSTTLLFVFLLRSLDLCVVWYAPLIIILGRLLDQMGIHEDQMLAL